MVSRTGLYVLLFGASGCFTSTDPSIVDTEQAGSTSTGVTSSDTTGSPATEGPSSTTPATMTSSSSGVDTDPTAESTTADPTSVDTDSTGAGGCNDASAPCPESQYCVRGTCQDPPANMVAVPGGPFMMGCSDSDPLCDDDESPYHEVTLSPFAIDRYEVTLGEYRACMDATSCTVPAYDWASCVFSADSSEANPIDCVSWLQAQAYCAWNDKRLPTEAEWEKAARGTDERIFPWGDQPASCTYAVMADCDFFNDTPRAMDVGSKPAGASPYGALDMAGNVYEWVYDWYAPGFYVASPDENPTGPKSAPADGTHSARGGSFSRGAHEMRASDRGASHPEFNSVWLPEDAGAVGVGFRCAASPE
ncbi:MAG: SUMF1/EgtB/PvdO family nonheme iron enzyme [Nannocystales bacterium]